MFWHSISLFRHPKWHWLKITCIPAYKRWHLHVVTKSAYIWSISICQMSLKQFLIGYVICVFTCTFLKYCTCSFHISKNNVHVVFTFLKYCIFREFYRSSRFVVKMIINSLLNKHLVFKFYINLVFRYLYFKCFYLWYL